MKFLFIGFSEQNANLLSFLIEQNYANVKCVCIERQALDQNSTFTLPNIDAHKDAQYLIINLDGVGMLSYQSRHKASLLEFIGNRIAIITTRMSIDSWQEALSDSEHILCLQAPYNRNTMLDTLSAMVSKNPSKKSTAIESHNNSPSLESDTEELSKSQSRQPLEHNELVNHDNNQAQKLIEQILSHHFGGAYQSPMVKEFSKIFYQSRPFILRTGRFQVLIDPAHNMAVSLDFARVLDYLEIAKNQVQFINSITIEPIDGQQLARHLQEFQNKQAKKQTLSALLLQIYHAILPNNIETTTKDLQVKVKFMPNFTNLDDIPSHTQEIIAACLSSPRTLDDLYTIFNHVNPLKLNRIFILMILSKIADLDVLNSPRKTTLLSSNNGLTDKNHDVNKANKTGFFRRLLNKLAH